MVFYTDPKANTHIEYSSVKEILGRQICCSKSSYVNPKQGRLSSVKIGVWNLWPRDCPTCILVFVEGSSVSYGYKYNCCNYSRAQVDLDLESIQWSQEKERDPDIFEEDDFPPCPPDWSDLDMETYNKRKQEVMGKPIWVQDVDEEDLKELGYLSWKSYVIDSCISNWWPPSLFHIVLMVKSHWTNCQPDQKSPERETGRTNHRSALLKQKQDSKESHANMFIRPLLFLTTCCGPDSLGTFNLD